MSGRILWLDTVRVFSALTVIIGHYAACFTSFEKFDTINFLFVHAGNVGVFLFLALSGYLISGSLARSKGLGNFYRRKLIRIVIPFTVAYVMLGAALMVLGLLNISIAERSPFYGAIYQGKFDLGILIAMFPVDVNLTTALGLPLTWFVGEWFMGVIIWLYLIAPFLYRFVQRAPLITFAVSIVISVATFYASQGLVMQGLIRESWWLFPTRIPEFIFGMILFTCKDFFEVNRRRLLICAGGWTLIIGAVTIAYNSPVLELVNCLYPTEPRSLLLTIPSTYLFFICAAWLNEQFPIVLAKFNSFSDVSYMAMLIQHVVIYLFAAQLRFEELHTVGAIVVVLLITLVIIGLSNWLKTFSDAVEKLT